MRKRDRARARGKHEGRVPRVLGMAGGKSMLDSHTRRVFERKPSRSWLTLDSDDLGDFDEAGEQTVRRRRLLEPAASSGFSDHEDDNVPIIENLEDMKGIVLGSAVLVWTSSDSFSPIFVGNTLREWISMESTRREIHRRFRIFLTTFVDAHVPLVS
jgi:hypothetical protein